MDILGNKNEVLCGQYGYVTYIKQKAFNTAIKILFAALILFYIGTTYFTQYEQGFIVTSMVMFVPAAQFFARYFSFRVYKPTDERAFKHIESIHKSFLVLGGLPLIDGRKTQFYKIIVIVPHGVYGFINEKDSIDLSIHHLEALLHIRGYQVPIHVFQSANELENALNNLVDKGIIANIKRQEAIAEELIRKSH